MKASLVRRQGRFGIEIDLDDIMPEDRYEMSDSSTERTSRLKRLSKHENQRKIEQRREAERKKREEEAEKRANKLKMLQDVKNSYGFRLSAICRSKEPRSVPLDESKAEKLIGYRHYVNRKASLEWRAGRTFLDISGRLEYRSVWMTLINRLLFSPSLDEAESLAPLYYQTIGIDQSGENADILGDEINDPDLVAVALWLATSQEDLSVDRCLMPAADDSFDYEAYFDANFD